MPIVLGPSSAPERYQISVYINTSPTSPAQEKGIYILIHFSGAGEVFIYTLYSSLSPKKALAVFTYIVRHKKGAPRKSF